VRLTPGSSFLHRYPHELSGGQRQRVVLARALSVDPQFVIADEPVSMLDVSVRAGILALMASIQRERGAGFFYITHDLVSAHQIADRIVVMFGGRTVESGPADSVVKSPAHPYTRMLLEAIPNAVPPHRPPPS
jgi:peptide/nickel transport system ATP-binding protein